MKKVDESDDGEVIGEQKKKKSGGHQPFKYVENKEVSELSNPKDQVILVECEGSLRSGSREPGITRETLICEISPRVMINW